MHSNSEIIISVQHRRGHAQKLHICTVYSPTVFACLSVINLTLTTQALKSYCDVSKTRSTVGHTWLISLTSCGL